MNSNDALLVVYVVCGLIYLNVTSFLGFKDGLPVEKVRATIGFWVNATWDVYHRAMVVFTLYISVLLVVLWSFAGDRDGASYYVSEAAGISTAITIVIGVAVCCCCRTPRRASAPSGGGGGGKKKGGGGVMMIAVLALSAAGVLGQTVSRLVINGVSKSEMVGMRIGSVAGFTVLFLVCAFMLYACFRAADKTPVLWSVIAVSVTTVVALNGLLHGGGMYAVATDDPEMSKTIWESLAITLVSMFFMFIVGVLVFDCSKAVNEFHELHERNNDNLLLE